MNPPGVRAEMTPLTIVIPAAGSASRMRGTDKLLEPVQGHALLRRQVLTALPLAPVLVTLRPDDPRQAVLRGLEVTLIQVPDAATGLAASLRRAAAAVTSALMILPADMPDLTTEDLATVIAAFDLAPDTIHRGASSGGTPGHPVILPQRLLPEIMQLSGDEGARSLVARHGVTLVPLPADHALTDLDTPEDWAAWRAAQAASSTRTS